MNNIIVAAADYDYQHRLDRLTKEFDVDVKDMKFQVIDKQLVVLCIPCNKKIVCDGKTRAMGNVRDHLKRQSHRDRLLKAKASKDAKNQKQKETDDAFIVRQMCETYPHFRHLRVKSQLQCKHCNQTFVLSPERGSLSNNLREHVEKSEKCRRQQSKNKDQPRLNAFFAVTSKPQASSKPASDT